MLRRLRRRGRPGYAWGKSGRFWPYTPGNEASKRTARARAERDGKSRDPTRPSTGPMQRALGPYGAAVGTSLVRAALVGTPRSGKVSQDDVNTWREAMQARVRSIRAVGLPHPSVIGLHTGVALDIAANGARRRLIAAGLSQHELSIRLAVPVEQVIGIDIARTAAERLRLESWVVQATNDLGGVHRKAVRGLERVISQDIRAGVQWRTIRKKLQARKGITRRDAERIARKIIRNVARNIEEDTHRAAGVRSYLWRTSLDEIVRDEHTLLEGQEVAIDGPGAPGADVDGGPAHAGVPHGCRCWRDPVITL